MTPEWLTAFGTLGTFVVIAASAMAALMQLRHMRSGNQIAALTEIRETMESTDFRQALRWTAHELPRLLEEPRIRALIANPGPLSPELEQARTVANFFETTGAAVRHGFIDRRIACDLWGYVVIRNWTVLSAFIANRRAAVDPNLFEHFEYLAVISRHWTAEHRDGTYPKDLERMPLPEPWTIDRKDESSRVS